MSSIHQNTKSNLSLENRTTLRLTGIKKIKTTEPESVIASLENCIIIISGKNLSVQTICVKEGILELSGLVTGIRYTNSQTRRFSLKNLFK